MKPVIAPPLLPYPSSTDLKSLNQFDQDLRKALVEILTQYAFRLNGMLAADGSEPMQGNLNMGMFSIDDVASIFIKRVGAAAQYFVLGPSDATGHNIKGFSATNNAKGFIFDATTDNANTAPSGGDNRHEFRIRGVPKLVVLDNGAVDVRSGWLQFPATQVPSSGANVLDDYEEGTWTPVLNFGGATTGITYSVQDGIYIKVGRIVHVGFQVNLSSKGSATGAATLAGFPFTVQNFAASGGSGVATSVGGMAGLTSPVLFSLPANTTAALIRGQGAAATADLTDANFTNGSFFRASFTYIAAS